MAAHEPRARADRLLLRWPPIGLERAQSASSPRKFPLPARPGAIHLHARELALPAWKLKTVSTNDVSDRTSGRPLESHGAR
jgi:hypothetical protein